MIRELVISKNDIDFIRNEFEVNKPYEACGVIIGNINDNIAYTKKVISITNIRRTSASFELDPLGFFDAWNNADKNGDEIVGIYHTHPFYLARPSSWDIETMRNDSYVWVIAGVDNIMGYILDGRADDMNILNVKINTRRL